MTEIDYWIIDLLGDLRCPLEFFSCEGEEFAGIFNKPPPPFDRLAIEKALDRLVSIGLVKLSKRKTSGAKFIVELSAAGGGIWLRQNNLDPENIVVFVTPNDEDRKSPVLTARGLSSSNLNAAIDLLTSGNFVDGSRSRVGSVKKRLTYWYPPIQMIEHHITGRVSWKQFNDDRTASAPFWELFDPAVRKNSVLGQTRFLIE